jgi:hypothetical protein
METLVGHLLTVTQSFKVRELQVVLGLVETFEHFLFFQLF